MRVSDHFPAHYICWIAVPFALSACATMADIVGHREEGTTQIYDVSPDQAWEIAKVVFQNRGH